MATEVAVAYVSVVPEVRGFANQLRRQMVAPAGNAGRNAGAAASSSMAGALKTGMAAAAVATTAALAGIGIASLKVAGDFQQSMNKVKAVSGATGKEFQALEDMAKELGSTTQFSASQAAEAMGFLAMAGFDTKEIMQALPGTLDLAAAGAIGLGEAADIASNILSGYGMETKEIGRLNDVLAKTFTSTNVDMMMLGESFKYVAPVAAAAGLQFEEVSAAIGMLGNAGIQGSEAGTALRGSIAMLLKPSGEAEKAMKKLGFSATDSAGELRPLNEIIGQLEKSGASTADMMAIFGVEAGPAMMALVSQGSKSLKTLTKDLEESGGTAGKIAKTQQEGLNGAITGLKSAWEGLLLAIADSGILDAAEKLVDRFTDVIRTISESEAVTKGLKSAFTGLIEGTKATVKAIKDIVDVGAGVIKWLKDYGEWLIPAGVAIGGLAIALNASAIASGLATAQIWLYVTATGAASGATGLFSGAMGLLNTVMGLNPFVRVGILLAALISLIIVAYRNSETFRNIVDGAWAAVRTAFSTAWGVIQPIFLNMVAGFRSLWETCRTQFNHIMSLVKIVGAAFSSFWNSFVKPAFNGVASGARTMWGIVKGIYSALNTGTRAVGSVIQTMYNATVRPIFNSMADRAKWVWQKGIKPPFDAIKKATGQVSAAFTTAKDVIAKQWSKLESIAAKPVRFIINTVYNKGIVGVWNKVAGAFGAPKLSKVDGFARGGILPGQSSWRDGDDQLVPMRKGEGVYVSEAMRDPYERARLHAVNSAAMRGQSLGKFQGIGHHEGFAKGGIFGWVGKAANTAAGWGSTAWDKVKDGAAWLKEGLADSARAGVKAVVNPLVDQIPGLQGKFGSMVKAIPTKMIDSLLGHAKEADEKGGSGGGGKWAKPVNAAISTPYGKAGPMWSSGYHTGTDFAAPSGAAVKAVANGVIASIGRTGPYGNHIRMRHGGGMESLYAHLSSVLATSGSRVARGKTIGRVGSTGNSSGPHLHLEARKNGALMNPASLFDNGGWLQPGATQTVNKTGRPEPVLTNRQWADISTLAANGSNGLQPGDRIELTVDGRTTLEGVIRRGAQSTIDDRLTSPARRGRQR